MSSTSAAASSAGPLSPLVTPGVFQAKCFAGHLYFLDSMRSFAQLRLADEFISDSTTLTAAAIAGKHHWNAGRLYRLLRQLTFANIVQPVEQKASGAQDVDDPVSSAAFRLTDEGAMLKSSHPSHMRALLLWEFAAVMRFSADLRTELIQQPEERYLPGAARYVMSENNGQLMEYFAFLRQPAYSGQMELFDGAMTGYTYSEVQSLLASYPRIAAYHTLFDLGGNMGTLAAMVGQRHPSIQHLIVADLPPVIQAARLKDEGRTHGVSERLQLVEADFFDVDSLCCLLVHAQPAVASGSEWCIVMKNVLHDWSDEDSVRILSNLSQALHGLSPRPRVTLLVVEHALRPLESGGLNWYCHAFDVMMLSLTGGRERGKKDFEALFTQTGWQWKDVCPLQDSAVSVVEAVLTA